MASAILGLLAMHTSRDDNFDTHAVDSSLDTSVATSAYASELVARSLVTRTATIAVIAAISVVECAVKCMQGALSCMVMIMSCVMLVVPAYLGKRPAV